MVKSGKRKRYTIISKVTKFICSIDMCKMA